MTKALINAIIGNVYWSKDIIFLVTDKEMAGTQAWVDAYHGTGDQGK